uniref:SGNH/GDSL hydrolase family protein n=1 Tax=Eubacterium cellulosolvens TaxID=29322 RepID=UPI000488B88A|nr:SGNH/GDSL hydrolase family protein [[Eubacterium] cellulosolvens]
MKRRKNAALAAILVAALTCISAPAVSAQVTDAPGYSVPKIHVQTAGASSEVRAAKAAGQTVHKTPVRVLCVGDSITDGYINQDNGYRKYFCYFMQQNGIAVDMVGPKNNWTNEMSYTWNGKAITYDPANAGYSGYAIMKYSGREGIYETIFDQNYSDGNRSGDMITAYDPDIILLQIGTNDLLDARYDKIPNGPDVTAEYTMPERLEKLVDAILSKMNKNAVLFVSTVPDIDVEEKTDWLLSYGWIWNVPTSGDLTLLKEKVQDNIDRYNASVVKLVEKKQQEGARVRLGDVHSCINLKGGDLYDGVHPSEQGYAKMGEDWAKKVTSFETDPSGTPTTTPAVPTLKPTTAPTAVPTATQKPTATPKPTSTTKPTSVPTPTEAPEPTLQPVPTKNPSGRVLYRDLKLDGTITLGKFLHWEK